MEQSERKSFQVISFFVQIHHSVLHKSHVYRRGPWKLILGQVGIPLAEVELYREPVRWIAEDGNICDTFAEMAIWWYFNWVNLKVNIDIPLSKYGKWSWGQIS